MHRIFGRSLTFVIFWLMAVAAAAQNSPPSQIELNGFLLGQYARAADGHFGKPFEIRTTDDNWKQRIYVFDKRHGSYMVFEFSPDDPERMIAIQLAGDAGTAMRPFHGLVLGDENSKVLRILGQPAEIKHEDDYNVDLYTYANRNYSVEVNHNGKLSSIRILGFTGFADPPANEMSDVDRFRKLIVNRDVDHLLSALAGDLEIYRGDHTYTFTRPARTEIEDPTSEISCLLFGKEGSLWAAFTTEKFEPDTSLRIYEKAPAGWVAKFPHSKIINEIAFKSEAGTWKLWEIALRDTKAGSKQQ